MVHIVAIGTSVPDFIATNDYVVSIAIEHSVRHYNGDIAELEFELKTLLERAGSNRRRWRAGFTKPLEHVSDAWLNCLNQLEGGAVNKIGALIYCGIDKGVFEPSQASLLAQKFGLKSVRTFDISDACMGWFTATQTASAFVTKERPYCAIVSAEFPMEFPGKVYPRSFEIRDGGDLQWKGAALTLGECASVTVIDAFDRSIARHVFISNNELADTCCVPAAKPERFVDSQRLIKKLADDCFVADMGRMTWAGYRDGQDALRRYVTLFGAPDILLPHTVSQTGPAHAARDIIKSGALKNCFRDFGNIATCSLPVGYELFGCANERIGHVAGWISAAGMSHAAFRLF